MMLVLKIFSSLVFVFMIYSTVQTSIALNLFEHLPTLLKDPWAVMTLYDAYFAFLFFYTWIFYKENNWLLRILWLVLVLALGTIAMSLYLLIQIFKLKEKDSIEELLLNKK
ncbi:MAG: DUF1475 family protein [Leptospiraceae bacterium]|nr:DUF1475 family protein [Leptospiraceae bacterium]